MHTQIKIDAYYIRTYMTWHDNIFHHATYITHKWRRLHTLHWHTYTYFIHTCTTDYIDTFLPKLHRKSWVEAKQNIVRHYSKVTAMKTNTMPFTSIYSLSLSASHDVHVQRAPDMWYVILCAVLKKESIRELELLRSVAQLAHKSRISLGFRPGPAAGPKQRDKVPCSKYRHS